MQAKSTVIPDSVNRFWKFYLFTGSSRPGVFCEHLFLQNTSAGCLIYRKNILGKQLSQTISSKYRSRYWRCSIKKTQTQVFFCEFCNIFKNTFFTEHLRATAALNTFSDCFTCNKISNSSTKWNMDPQSCRTVHKCSMKKLLWWIL